MNINWQFRELNLKIVYYGPALSGKTTNLEQIHARINPQHRSELVSLKTHEDRTLFFDFMQLELGKISGLQPKIHLYTVPGQSYYEASRRLVLRGADGVVFVADSAPDRITANLHAWQELEAHLRSFDFVLSETPIILQCNKQDKPEAMSVQQLKDFLHASHLPAFPAVAAQGDGVFDTLKAITSGVLSKLQSQFIPA